MHRVFEHNFVDFMLVKGIVVVIIIFLLLSILIFQLYFKIFFLKHTCKPMTLFYEDILN